MEESRSMTVTFTGNRTEFKYDGFPTVDDNRNLVRILQLEIELHERTNKGQITPSLADPTGIGQLDEAREKYGND